MDKWYALDVHGTCYGFGNIGGTPCQKQVAIQTPATISRWRYRPSETREKELGSPCVTWRPHFSNTTNNQKLLYLKVLYIMSIVNVNKFTTNVRHEKFADFTDF